MAAVLALALALATPAQRPLVIQATALATTRWVAEEPGSDLACLLGRLGARWSVEPLAFHAALAFHGTCHPALARYEEGYVKEGVGAGGLALLWEWSGRDPEALSRLCSLACDRLLPLAESGAGERLASSDG